MLRSLLCLALVTLMSASWATTGASSTYFGFTVGVSNAPPPPRVVLVERPTTVVAPGTSVYVVSDPAVEFDMFRYGSYWYVSYSGYWYRSKSYGGRYTVIDVRSVPRSVVTLPAKHWKHHPLGGPPGKMKKRGGPRA